MDAREQLRRYLEQRREQGEQDLVLDAMDVDEVLRLVGAVGRAGAAAGDATTRDPAGGRPRSDPPPGPRSPEPAPRAQAAPAPGDRDSRRAVEGDRGDRAGPPASGISDWRAVLRASDREVLERESAPPTREGRAPGGPGTPDAGELAPAADDAVGGSEKLEGQVARPRSRGKEERGNPPGEAPATGTRAPRGGGSDATPAALPDWLSPLGIEAGLVVEAAQSSEPTISRLPTLEALARATEKCTRCQLYRTATHAVPGEGNPRARLVCVGEAPGANEDASGRPFVGAAGQLLTRILEAIKLTREEVFICNVIKHRPPGNRNPEPGEVEACSPYLLRQLELIRPAVIVTLGSFAAQTLLATRTPIGKLRGRVHLYNGTPLVVTYHPAALLRNPAWKRPTWEDVQLARRILDSAPDA